MMRISIAMVVIISLLSVVLLIRPGANPNRDTSSESPSEGTIDGSLKLPKSGKLPVAIVVGRNAEVLDFSGPLEVFAFAYTAEGQPAFEPYLVAETMEPVTVGGGMKVVPQYSFADAPQPKIIVIPAMSDQAVSDQMLEWIRKAAPNTDVTMTVCNGAFVLAKTGLLNGQPATCHHGGYFRFAGQYPEIKLQRGSRFVETGNLASAGGVSSGIDLALHIVRRYLGKSAAAQIADGIEYQGDGWLDPNSNQAYAKFTETDEAHPICPLCQMEGDKSLKSTHKGKNYYFCHPSEKQFFDSHVEVVDRFLSEDAVREQAKSK